MNFIQGQISRMNHIGSSLDEGSGTDLFGRENKTHVVSKLLAQSIFVAGCLSEKKNSCCITPQNERKIPINLNLIP